MQLGDFWHYHPAELDVLNAAHDVAPLRPMLNSPLDEAMLVMDGLGRESYDPQWDDLEVVYDDWEQHLGMPFGTVS